MSTPVLLPDLGLAYPEEQSQVSVGEIIFLAGFLIGGGLGWIVVEFTAGGLWWPVLGALCGSLAGLLVNFWRWGVWARFGAWLSTRWSDWLEE